MESFNFCAPGLNVREEVSELGHEGSLLDKLTSNSYFTVRLTLICLKIVLSSNAGPVLIHCMMDARVPNFAGHRTRYSLHDFVILPPQIFNSLHHICHIVNVQSHLARKHW